jgi:hypothetical protein
MDVTESITTVAVVATTDAIDPAGDSGSINSMVGTAEILRAIDVKIAELEREKERLQVVMRQLAAVVSKLDALKKSRAVLAETDLEIPPEAGSGPANGNGANGSPTPPIPGITVSRVVPGSIGAITLEILHQAGKPLKVDEILNSVHQKGKPDVTQATLVSTLSTYVSSGKLRRPAPSTYELAVANA